MARRPRRCISVRRIIYCHLIELALERRLSVCGLIYAIVVAELERAGLAEGLPVPRFGPFDASRTKAPGEGRRRSVSLSAAVAKRFDELAGRRETRPTTLLDNLCCDELERAGVTVPRVCTPSREYRNEGRPRRISRVRTVRDEFEQPWHGGYRAF